MKTMNTKEELSIYGYVRQNFEQKCLIHEILITIIEFFKNKGGFLYVCGNGNYGRLGIKEYYGWDKYCMEPTLVQSVNEVIDSAANNNHSMLVDYEGKVLAFGQGEHGALGTGNDENVEVPQQIPLKHRAISVCAGYEHSLILADNGAVLSCGRNYDLQLGHGNIGSQSVPKIIEALKEHKIIKISAGYSHNGALSENGVLFTWGRNYSGQCGVGEEKGKYIYTPTTVNLNEKVSMIECGDHHSLLITMSNLLYSFGEGDSYKLGHGTEENKYVPSLVEALKDVNVINVAGGGQHTLCVDDAFDVWTFGNNQKGQCGHSRNIEEQKTPKKIQYFAENEIKAKAVAVGYESSCVITQNNECFVFGDNEYHNIGLKEKRNYFLPTKLPLFVQKVSIGEYHSTFISDYRKE